VRNSYTQSCTDGFVGTYHADSDWNLSDLAGDAPGANSKNSTDITFVDEANDDFRLDPTDAGAQNSGFTLRYDADNPFDTDILGTSRRAAWDIGPYQIPMTDRSGVPIDRGTTLYVDGEVTARGGAFASGSMKIELFDSDDALVATIVSPTAFTLSDDATKAYSEISPPNISYNFDTVGLYYIRISITNDDSDVYTDQIYVSVRPITPSVTAHSVDGQAVTLTVDGPPNSTISVDYAATDGSEGAEFGSRTGPGDIGPVNLTRGKGYQVVVQAEENGVRSDFAWYEIN
jgi:hypothetical protein